MQPLFNIIERRISMINKISEDRKNTNDSWDENDILSDDNLNISNISNISNMISMSNISMPNISGIANINTSDVLSNVTEEKSTHNKRD
jgi:hypothetical protein